MNTKTTKTIVFAALIAAMILPFGGMQTAYADHTTEHAEPRDGSHGQTADYDTKMAEKRAALVSTLDFVNAELAMCDDATVVAGLEALKVIVETAIAEIDYKWSP